MMDPESGELKGRRIHQDALLQCCSSLICLEKDGADKLIILAHYSVRQFLLAHHQTENDTVELQLGELCITHLHRHNPVRDLVRFQQANVPITTGFASTIASIVAPLLFRSRTRSADFTNIRLPVRARKEGDNFDRKTFLFYSKEHWASLTRYMSAKYSSYSKFEKVALLNSKTWWIYPWQRHYESDISHV
jgi:hypothetical protein